MTSKIVQQIHHAQVVAGEDAVIANLQRLGLTEAPEESKAQGVLDTAVNLTNFDTDAAIEVVWAALFAYRENVIPEGDAEYDKAWDEVCTAMGWISEVVDEVAHWKALHDNSVEAARFLIERTYLPLKRVSAYKEFLAMKDEIARLRRELKAINTALILPDGVHTPVEAINHGRDLLEEYREHNAKLREALNLAKTGLVWYVENTDLANGCDDEAMVTIEEALSLKELT